ncbi:hypothetical protein B0H11DRAFT_2205453 [Mycena galericulata]|nr:hypothetical protein B0H11DRAFT_2205453 [Mycena galericulata]
MSTDKNKRVQKKKSIKDIAQSTIKNLADIPKPTTSIRDADSKVLGTLRKSIRDEVDPNLQSRYNALLARSQNTYDQTKPNDWMGVRQTSTEIAQLNRNYRSESDEARKRRERDAQAQHSFSQGPTYGGSPTSGPHQQQAPQAAQRSFNQRPPYTSPPQHQQAPQTAQRSSNEGPTYGSSTSAPHQQQAPQAAQRSFNQAPPYGGLTSVPHQQRASTVTAKEVLVERNILSPEELRSYDPGPQRTPQPPPSSAIPAAQYNQQSRTSHRPNASVQSAGTFGVRSSTDVRERRSTSSRQSDSSKQSGSSNNSR